MYCRSVPYTDADKGEGVNKFADVIYGRFLRKEGRRRRKRNDLIPGVREPTLALGRVRTQRDIGEVRKRPEVP